MATVSVDTQLLISGGNSITKYHNDNKSYYNNVNSLSINNCSAFDNFKSKLSTQFSTYTTHCEKASSRLIECANELENVDNQIASTASALSADTSSDIETSSASSDIASITIGTDIKELVNLSASERTQIFDALSSSLNNAVNSIESGNKTYKSNSGNALIDTLIDEFIEQVSTTDSNGTTTYKVNDLVKNDFYNGVVKKYGELANVKITPNMLRYASKNGLPLIRENVSEYNLQLYGTDPPTEAGEEYNFYKMGIAYGDEKTSQYSTKLYNSKGTYQRKYSYYPDSMTYHYNSKSWYICDDGIYRDADGYIICADRHNMGYNENGTVRNVIEINNSGNAIIVDTPFGPEKVYDFCGAGNIDIYVHR